MSKKVYVAHRIDSEGLFEAIEEVFGFLRGICMVEKNCHRMLYENSS